MNKKRKKTQKSDQKILLSIILVFLIGSVLASSYIVSSDMWKRIYKSEASEGDSFPQPLILSEKQLSISIKGIPYESELTPLVLFDGNEYIYTLSTAWSFFCLSQSNVLQQNVILDRDKCVLATKPSIVEGISQDGVPRYRKSDELGTKDWQFSYHGITGAFLDIEPTSQMKRIVTINHGEHQNIRVGATQFQGRMYPEISVDTCAGGYVDGVFQQCWDSFASFASLSTYTFSKTSDLLRAIENNIGPITWPRGGYKNANGGKSNSGPYHPTLFIDNGFAYVYYVAYGIHNPWNANGLFSCTTVVRAPLDQITNPKAWRIYRNGLFEKPSLPKNFSHAHMSTFLQTAGERSDCLNLPGALNKGDASLYFNVAKIQGTDDYIGVQEFAPENKSWKMGVRFSKDLIHWSELHVLSEASKNWGAGDYHYPTFYRKDGKSNSRIDPDEFYILGKRATNAQGYELNSMKLTLGDDVGRYSRSENMIKQYYRVFLGWDVDRSNPAFREGIDWHIKQLDSFGLQVAVTNFISGEEYQKRKRTNREFIEDVYRGMLSRDPDGLESGSNWWVGRLDRGEITREQLIEEVSQGWEAQCVWEKGKIWGVHPNLCKP